VPGALPAHCPAQGTQHEEVPSSAVQLHPGLPQQEKLLGNPLLRFRLLFLPHAPSKSDSRQPPGATTTRSVSIVHSASGAQFPARSVSIARKPQLPHAESTNQPPAIGFSGRVVPAFVMHCDFSESEYIEDMFRYEVVSHPEDLGASKSLVRHWFVAVWRDGPYIAVCRVKANESFLADGGIMPLNDILESFRTEEEADPNTEG